MHTYGMYFDETRKICWKLGPLYFVLSFHENQFCDEVNIMLFHFYFSVISLVFFDDDSIDSDLVSV